MSPSKLTVEAWPVTDKGQADENHDTVLIYEPSNANQVRFSGNLYVIADGVGAGPRAKLASEYAARRVMHFYYTHDEPDLGLRLREAVETANADLFNYTQEQPELIKMGASMVAASVRGEELHVAWVGDSRAYVIRDGETQQITHDHTLVQQLLDEAAITDEEAREHPRRDVVLRSLGAEETVRVEVVDLRLKPDDALVLTSGGLTRYLHQDEIAGIVGTSSPRSAAETLLRKTLDRGGKENVSVVTALMRDGAPQLQTITEHTWDGMPASFDQQPTLMIRRSELQGDQPLSPDQTVPHDVDAHEFLEGHNAPVGTSLPPDIPEPPVESGDTLVRQPRPGFEDQTMTDRPGPAWSAPSVQPAPPFTQNVQPAPQQPPGAPPVPPAAIQPPYGQRAVPRGYASQQYTPPPGYAIDPVTGLPPVPPGVEPGYVTYQNNPYGPRIYQPPAQPNVRARRGIPIGRFIAAGILAVILTAVMVVLLVNPLNWTLPFGGTGAAEVEFTPTSLLTTPTVPVVAEATTPPAAGTQESGTGGTGMITAAPTVSAPEGMVLIDGGPFMRGVPDEEIEDAIVSCIQESGGGTCNREYFTDAQPVEEVTLSPFFIDITEVTNLDYAECVIAEVCTTPEDQEFYADPAYGQHPVVFVNHAQATQYCGWAGKRLPTEAEWEKAARWDDLAADSYIFPWGDTYENGKANTLAAGQGGTTAVQAFAGDISPYSILGMGGNVSEWVADWYFPGYTGLGTLNPTGPATQPLSEAQRVVRGGSFLELMAYSRAGHRLSAEPGSAADWIGFRCAQSVGGGAPVAPTATSSAATAGPASTGEATLPATITVTPQP